MRSRTILVAEDEDFLRRRVSAGLRARFPGVNVIEAEDGLAARMVLEKSSVDLILTDLEMPRLRGVELVAWVANRRIPIQVIVVSAHVNDETRGILGDLGALVCMEKPVDAAALHAAVERMLTIPRAYVSGVTLAGFVQLLELEQRSCALRVVGPEQTGLLVFDSGVMVDAWTQGLEGDEAAIAILGMQEYYTLDLVAASPSCNRRVRRALSFLLLESARRVDESGPQKAIVSTVPVDSSASSAPRPENSFASVFPMAAPAQVAEPSVSCAAQLEAAIAVEGAIFAAMVNFESDELIGYLGESGPRFEPLAIEAANIVRAEIDVLTKLGLRAQLEEILVSSANEYHFLRPQQWNEPTLFLFLVVDRARGNLAISRQKLAQIDDAARSTRNP